MNISLNDITWDNWEECLRLSVKPEQDKFVAKNLYSLAQSYIALINDRLPPITKAIYSDGQMVGFVMAGYKSEEESDEHISNYDIYRFMIDKKFQSQGYGRAAFAKVLEYLKTYPQGKSDAIKLSYVPDNTVAKQLYDSFGFQETGEMDDDEAISILRL